MNSDLEKEIELIKRSLRSAIAVTRGLRTIDVELEGPDNRVVINKKKLDELVKIKK